IELTAPNIARFTIAASRSPTGAGEEAAAIVLASQSVTTSALQVAAQPICDTVNSVSNARRDARTIGSNPAIDMTPALPSRCSPTIYCDRMSVWDRIKEHKVVQWTVAYAAAAYTLLHAMEMVSDALEWPHIIIRILTLLLILGAPL